MLVINTQTYLSLPNQFTRVYTHPDVFIQHLTKGSMFKKNQKIN